VLNNGTGHGDSLDELEFASRQPVATTKISFY
jgi:hypothetical protein